MQMAPYQSLPCIFISLFEVIGMPILVKCKEQIVKKLNSSALAGEAACSIVCAYMAATVLGGLLLNYVFHWWWAEHVAALLFLYWLAGETKEAFDVAQKKKGSSCC